MRKSILPTISIALYSLAMPPNSLANPINLATLLRLPQNSPKGPLPPFKSINGISGPTIEAISFVESSHNPKAIAYNPHAQKKYGKMGSAAHGLMQVRGLYAGTPICPEATKYTDLYNPVINIKCGSRLLRYELNRHDDDLPLALAAYYAGPKCTKGGVVCDAAKGYVNKVLMILSKSLTK